jgi:hypothetical protein
MEQSTVNQRLNLLVDTFENGVKAAFARKAGISPQGAQELLAGRKGDPSFKVLVKILESYPTVNANWLVLGIGEMLLPKPTEWVDPFAWPSPSDEAKEHRQFLPPLPENDPIKKDMDLLAKAMNALLSSNKSEEAQTAKSILAGYFLTERDTEDEEWKHEARAEEAAEWNRQTQERQAREQQEGQQ